MKREPWMNGAIANSRARYCSVAMDALDDLRQAYLTGALTLTTAQLGALNYSICILGERQAEARAIVADACAPWFSLEPAAPGSGIRGES